MSATLRCAVCGHRRQMGAASCEWKRRRRTLAKYLHTVSEAELRSWLKGQALPAWQAPCRKNLQGTCDVSGAGAKHRISAQRSEFPLGAMRRRLWSAQAWVLLWKKPHGRAKVRRRGEQRTRGTSRPVKASARHPADHATRAAALWGNVETPAAHMAMLAWVGGRHRLLCLGGTSLGTSSLRFRRREILVSEWRGRPELRKAD